MIKKSSFFGVLAFVFALTFSISVNATSITPITVALKGLNWTNEANFNISKESCKLLIVDVENNKESLEPLIYCLRKAGEDTPILTGEVPPGQSVSKHIPISESGEYIITLDCFIPPNIHFALPPCKGKASVYRISGNPL